MQLRLQSCCLFLVVVNLVLGPLLCGRAVGVIATSDFTGVTDAPVSDSLGAQANWDLRKEDFGPSFGTVDIVSEEILLTPDGVNSVGPVYNWDALWDFRTAAGGSAPNADVPIKISWTQRSDFLAGGMFPPVMFINVPSTITPRLTNDDETVPGVALRMFLDDPNDPNDPEITGWGVDIDFLDGIDPTSPIIGAGDTALMEWVINPTGAPLSDGGETIDAETAGIFVTNTTAGGARTFVGLKGLENVTDPAGGLRVSSFSDGWTGTFDNFCRGTILFFQRSRL